MYRDVLSMCDRRDGGFRLMLVSSVLVPVWLEHEKHKTESVTKTTGWTGYFVFVFSKKKCYS